jgi:hypothetical protein
MDVVDGSIDVIHTVEVVELKTNAAKMIQEASLKFTYGQNSGHKIVHRMVSNLD